MMLPHKAEANQRGGPRISSPESRGAVWVIPTLEKLMIAQYVRDLLFKKF